MRSLIKRRNRRQWGACCLDESGQWVVLSWHATRVDAILALPLDGPGVVVRMRR